MYSDIFLKKKEIFYILFILVFIYLVINFKINNTYQEILEC